MAHDSPGAEANKPRSPYHHARYAVTNAYYDQHARRMTPAATCVYGQLDRHTQSSGLASISVGGLVTATGLGRTAVCDALDDLRAAGLIALVDEGRPGVASRYTIFSPAVLAGWNPAAAARLQPLDPASAEAAAARAAARATLRDARRGRLGLPPRAATPPAEVLQPRPQEQLVPAPAPPVEVLEPVETIAAVIRAEVERSWPGCTVRCYEPYGDRGWVVRVVSPGGAGAAIPLGSGEPIARAAVLERLARAVADLRHHDEEAVPAPAAAQEADGPLDFGPPQVPIETIAHSLCAEAEAAWPGCTAKYGRATDSWRCPWTIWITPPDGGAVGSVSLGEEDSVYAQVARVHVTQTLDQMRRAAAAAAPEPKPAPVQTPPPRPSPRPVSYGSWGMRGPSPGTIAQWAAQAAESRAEPAPAVETVAPAIGSAWSPGPGADAAFGSPVAA